MSAGAPEWMDFMETAVSSGVMTGHVVSIGSLVRSGGVWRGLLDLVAG